MPIFSIYTESILGISHSGEVTAEGTGTIKLTDEEVQQLKNLIRENGGETSIVKLKLEEKYPEIYKKLDDAYHEAAYEAEYAHWVRAGYENGWYDVPSEDILEKCESKYGFQFEYDAEDFFIEGENEVDEDELIDAKMEALDDWINDYCSQHPEKEIAFLADVFQLDPVIDGVDFEIEIPFEIIQIAKIDR